MTAQKNKAGCLAVCAVRSLKTKPNLTLNPQPSSLNRLNSVWDGDWAILEEYGPSNVLVQKYVQGYHGLVKTLQDNIYYYQDELGSTSHIGSGTGALIESYQYDLYGKPRVYNPSGVYQVGATPVAKDLFTGQRWVSEIGLYDDRNRFMSPDLGRFLQPDPIGFKGDASNLYRYCGNDWANRIDLDGLDWYDPVHDFINGVGDGVTFGITESMREHIFHNNATVNQNSAAYKIGNFGALGVGMLSGKSEVKLGAKELATLAARTARTKTERLLQHLTPRDLSAAAREAKTGIKKSGEHLKEVSEAARGLRERIKDINQGLSNPNLNQTERKALESELGKASKGLDAAERALESRNVEPPKEGPKADITPDNSQNQPGPADGTRLNNG